MAAAPESLRWALLAGGRRGQKARAVERVLAALRERGIKPAGFVQVREGDTHVLARLGRDARLTLTRPQGTAREGEDAFCGQLFSLAGFAAAKAWLEEDGPAARLWLVDEVSKLEAAGRGHRAAVDWAFSNAGARPVVLVVRADQLFEVMTSLGLEHAPIASLEGEVDDAAARSFVDALLG